MKWVFTVQWLFSYCSLLNYSLQWSNYKFTSRQCKKVIIFHAKSPAVFVHHLEGTVVDVHWNLQGKLNLIYIFCWLLFQSWMCATPRPALSLTTANPLSTSCASRNALSSSQGAGSLESIISDSPCIPSTWYSFLELVLCRTFWDLWWQNCIWLHTGSYRRTIWSYFFHGSNHQFLIAIGYSWVKKGKPNRLFRQIL